MRPEGGDGSSCEKYGVRENYFVLVCGLSTPCVSSLVILINLTF